MAEVNRGVGCCAAQFGRAAAAWVCAVASQSVAFADWNPVTGFKTGSDMAIEAAPVYTGPRLAVFGGTLGFLGSAMINGPVIFQEQNGWGSPVVTVEGAFNVNGSTFILLDGALLVVNDAASGTVATAGETRIAIGSQATVGAFTAGNDVFVYSPGSSLHVMGDFAQTFGQFRIEDGGAFQADGTLEHSGEAPGEMFVSAGSHLRVGKTLHLSDDALVVGGAILIGAGDSPSPNTLRIGDGGTLAGSGSILANLFVDGGTVAPGDDVQALVVQGSFTQLPTGNFAIELSDSGLGGSTPYLEVFGTATIGGRLELTFADGFIATPGTAWTVLTASSIAGTFATVAPCGFDVNYLSNEVVVTYAAAGGLGDLNCDGIVNGADLGLLLSSWGPCVGCASDLNGDGLVDGADLGILLSAWTS